MQRLLLGAAAAASESTCQPCCDVLVVGLYTLPVRGGVLAQAWQMQMQMQMQLWGQGPDGQQACVGAVAAQRG
jgi:hypothetical protein